MLTIKRFFAYSLLFHAILITIAALSFVSAGRVPRQEEFFARLLSPEEFLGQTPLISPIPELRPTLPSRPRLSKPSPLREKSISKIREQELPSPKHSSDVEITKGLKNKSEIEEKIQRPGLSGPGRGGIPGIKDNTREKIFDKSVIGDIAKREIEKEKKERTFSFDVREMKYLGYLQRLKERIESVWIYPPSSAARGIYGDLVIRFTIKKNGRLEVVELMRTSGYKSLDDAALKALSDAEPFWPLPDEWGMETYTIVGHFIYTIYGYYVR